MRKIFINFLLITLITENSFGQYRVDSLNQILNAFEISRLNAVKFTPKVTLGSRVHYHLFTTSINGFNPKDSVNESYSHINKRFILIPSNINLTHTNKKYFSDGELKYYLKRTNQVRLIKSLNNQIKIEVNERNYRYKFYDRELKKNLPFENYYHFKDIFSLRQKGKFREQFRYYWVNSNLYNDSLQLKYLKNLLDEYESYQNNEVTRFIAKIVFITERQEFPEFVKIWAGESLQDYLNFLPDSVKNKLPRLALNFDKDIKSSLFKLKSNKKSITISEKLIKVIYMITLYNSSNRLVDIGRAYGPTIGNNEVKFIVDNFKDNFKSNLYFLLGHEIGHIYLNINSNDLLSELACDEFSLKILNTQKSKSSLEMFELLLIETIEDDLGWVWGELDTKDIVRRYNALQAVK